MTRKMGLNPRTETTGRRRRYGRNDDEKQNIKNLTETFYAFTGSESERSGSISKLHSSWSLSRSRRRKSIKPNHVLNRDGDNSSYTPSVTVGVHFLLIGDVVSALYSRLRKCKIGRALYLLRLVPRHRRVIIRFSTPATSKRVST